MKQIGIIVAILLLLPFASAASTEITVKTLPAREVFITILQPGDEGVQITSPQRFLANYKGEAQYTFADNSVTNFKVLVVVRWQGEREFREEFGPYSAGEPIRVELLPAGYVDPLANQQETTEEIPVNESTSEEIPEQNVTENVTESTTEPQTEAANKTITGNAIFDSENGIVVKNWKYILYGVGVLVILFGLIFSVVKITKKRKDKFVISGMQPTNLFPPKKEKSEFSEMDKIENEIQQVEAEIARVKKMDKIKEAETRLDDKKRELIDLKKRYLGYS